ncbi:uncharacterized protein TNCV_3598081 [Trichonephila clavipes]|nr:uncharacterized protein TNCV_3598081 [Trichonephila clavipes]
MQLIKLLQVFGKLVGSYHGAARNVLFLVHTLMRGVRKGSIGNVFEFQQHLQGEDKQSELLKNILLLRSFDHHQALGTSRQLTKLAPHANGQVFDGRTLRERVVYQTKKGILLAVGSKIFGLGSQPGMIQGDANHFGIAAIPGNHGNGQFDGHWLVVVMKHFGMSKIAWLTRDRHVASI